MNYVQCLLYLEKLGDEIVTMKFGLETIRTLLKKLGNPQTDYPSILIAGTNGKGSTACFLHSVFVACGIPCALYTSPHLVCVEERLVVNGQQIDSKTFAHYFTRVVEVIEELGLSHHPTYFETLTAVAFLYFSEMKVQVAVLEVGMGGRLDSTNIVNPILSVLTRVGFDHEKFLGNSLEEIAAEKSGILRGGCPALTVSQLAPVQRVLLREAEMRNPLLYILDEEAIQSGENREGRYNFHFHGVEYALQIYGYHQMENAALAVQSMEILQRFGFAFPSGCIKRGIETVQLKGRVQMLSGNPRVVFDGMHNMDAAKQLARFLRSHTPAPRSLVFAMMRDKRIGEVLKILNPCFEQIYLTSIPSARAATVEELKRIHPSGIAVDELEVAYRRAHESGDTVVVGGSFFLVGELLKKL